MHNKKTSVVMYGCVESSKTALLTLNKIDNLNVKFLITSKRNSFNHDHVNLEEFVKPETIILYTEEKSDQELSDIIGNSDVDIGFCVGWSKIIPKSIYSKCKLFFAYHPSLLPKNRGRNPITWALSLGLSKTGSTFFLISNTPDSGPIVSQKTIEITKQDDVRSLYHKIKKCIEKQIYEIINDFNNNKLIFVEQNETEANYWRKRNDHDAIIDWRMSTKAILNLVRSLSKPYLEAKILVNSNEYNVKRAVAVDIDGIENSEPGKILEVIKDETIIKTGDGAISIVLEQKNLDLKKGEYL